MAKKFELINILWIKVELNIMKKNKLLIKTSYLISIKIQLKIYISLVLTNLKKSIIFLNQ